MEVPGNWPPPQGNDHTRFTYLEYLRMVQTFLEQGYKLCTFENFDPGSPHLILRHDVDIDLDKALQLARIEADHGIESTFFVLLSSGFYNIFSLLGRRFIEELVSLGHRIGLHFDPMAYPEIARSPQVLIDSKFESVLNQECRYLENLLGERVQCTSVHRPAANCTSILGRPGFLSDRLNAYSDRYFSNATYFSDGAGYWSFGHPLQHPTLIERSGIQLNTHPYLWSESGNGGQKERLNECLECRKKSAIQEVARNFRQFRCSDARS